MSETACLALSNVVFRSSECQGAALDAGVLPACVQLLDAARPVATHTAVLNLLVNLADTNPAAQDALCSDEAARALIELLEAARSPRVLSGMCLLLSHAVWNHTANQRRFGDERTARAPTAASPLPPHRTGARAAPAARAAPSPPHLPSLAPHLPSPLGRCALCSPSSRPPDAPR